MRKLEVAAWLLAVAYAAIALWPASFWYDSGTMRVDDIRQGEQLELIFSGGARRDFIGSYSVIIRDAHSNQVIVEDRSAPFEYFADSRPPDPLTIEWWAPGSEAMHGLPPGSYIMKTCWTIHGRLFGLMPAKTTCVASNIFRVTE